MHPFIAILASLNTKTSTVSFWNDPERIQRLSDPPSEKYLRKIQEVPWRGGLEPLPIEGIPLHEAKVVQGKIPRDLQGVLYRNGPGRTRIGDTQYAHWFDSDGIVSALFLDGEAQRATFMAKYVETERFKAQCRVKEKSGDVPMAMAGAWTKRGRGKFLENLLAIPTNPANTNVISFNDNIELKSRVFALAEGGDPVEIDPKTLDTLEVRAFSSSTNGETAASAFSAHHKRDPVTGDVYNHGVVLEPRGRINIMKLNSQGELVVQSATNLPKFSLTHDNMLSENYFLLVVQPFEMEGFNLMTSVLGDDPIGMKLKWNQKGSQTCLVFSKDTLKCVAKVPLPIFSTYHHIDAFEDPTNHKRITFRTLVHDPPHGRDLVERGFRDMYTYSHTVPLCQIMEYVVDIGLGERVISRRIAPHASPCEFPETNAEWGYRKRYVWTNTRVGAEGLNSLQKIDLETGECSQPLTFGESNFAGAPIFVAKEDAKNEDDGYIFSQIYRADEHRSDVVILDAATMRQIALLELESHITHQFHGGWCPRLQ